MIPRELVAFAFWTYAKNLVRSVTCDIEIPRRIERKTVGESANCFGIDSCGSDRAIAFQIEREDLIAVALDHEQTRLIAAQSQAICVTERPAHCFTSSIRREAQKKT